MFSILPQRTNESIDKLVGAASSSVESMRLASEHVGVAACDVSDLCRGTSGVVARSSVLIDDGVRLVRSTEASVRSLDDLSKKTSELVSNADCAVKRVTTSLDMLKTAAVGAAGVAIAIDLARRLVVSYDKREVKEAQTNKFEEIVWTVVDCCSLALVGNFLNDPDQAAKAWSLIVSKIRVFLSTIRGFAVLSSGMSSLSKAICSEAAVEQAEGILSDSAFAKIARKASVKNADIIAWLERDPSLTYSDAKAAVEMQERLMEHNVQAELQDVQYTPKTFGECFDVAALKYGTTHVGWLRSVVSAMYMQVCNTSKEQRLTAFCAILGSAVLALAHRQLRLKSVVTDVKKKELSVESSLVVDKPKRSWAQAVKEACVGVNTPYANILISDGVIDQDNTGKSMFVGVSEAGSQPALSNAFSDFPKEILTRAERKANAFPKDEKSYRGYDSFDNQKARYKELKSSISGGYKPSWADLTELEELSNRLNGIQMEAMSMRNDVDQIKHHLLKPYVEPLVKEALRERKEATAKKANKVAKQQWNKQRKIENKRMDEKYKSIPVVPVLRNLPAVKEAVEKIKFCFDFVYKGNCSRNNCPYPHVKPACRFGLDCNRSGCVYGHPKKEAILRDIHHFKPDRIRDSVGLVSDESGRAYCNATAIANRLWTVKHVFDDNRGVKFHFSNPHGSQDFDLAKMKVHDSDLVSFPLTIKLPSLSVAKHGKDSECMRFSYTLENGPRGLPEMTSNQGKITNFENGRYNASSMIGDCGGPVTNNDGNVVGIHRAGYPGETNIFVPMAGKGYVQNF